MSLLVLVEILGVFINTLAADGKYPVKHCGNLRLPIQIQLSDKRKTFTKFFVAFMETTLNFKQLKKKIMVITNVFPKLQTVKNFAGPFCKKHRLGTRFDSQHVKVSQILAKSS